MVMRLAPMSNACGSCRIRTASMTLATSMPVVCGDTFDVSAVH